MNQKALSFAELAVNTTKQLTSSYTEWTAFLGTVGRLYKYPYHEQVLIYAQRPDATACASFDVWNKRMNRAVRRGSRGIALMDTSEGNPRVRYVFDIADTVGRDKSRRPYLWQYRDEHSDIITSTLADHFDVPADSDLPYQLEVIADDLAGEYWAEHYADILACVPGSFLEEYDEFNIEAAFRSAASASTTYAMLSRCGLNPDEHFSHEDFMNVFDFNTPDAATALGTAVSENSELVLRQIEVVIKNFERTRRAERSNEHGEQHIIPAGGGIPTARAGHGDTIDLGQVRTDEGAVSEGGTPGTVQPPDSQREADGPLDGDRPDREPAVGADDAPAEREDGPDGAAESQRTHEMGGADEQRQGEGRGDDSGGVDLPVAAPAIDFTAVGPTGLQYSHHEIGNKDLPYFEDVSEKCELLWKCDALKKRRSEVAEQFATLTTVGERCTYLKSLFNNTYIEMILDSGQRVGYRAYDDVLHLWRGSFPSREQEEYLSWEDAVSAIEGMVQDGVWVEQTAAPEKPTPKKSQSKQDFEYPMDLFGLAGSTIPLRNEPGTNPVPARPRLSQNIIDAALTLGANDPDSRLRIIAEFMKDKPLEENVRFLQSHYKENGAGFYIGERKYSLWYNESGMQIAAGESALTSFATAITWEQAAERIRELLDEGLYADQSTLYHAWPHEQHRIAEAMEYLHRDIGEKYKDKYLPTLTGALSGTFVYPDVVEKTQELLEQPEQLKAVVDEFTAFMKDYAHNRDILRFHYHRPQEIMQGLEDLQRTPLEFTASPDYAPVERFFISQDEIDNLLREHPDNHDYRIEVNNFFEQNLDRKERDKYLSHLHGEYSGHHGGNDNIAYTYKELTFTHGDIIEPYAAVKMKWSQVCKRIDELIKKNAFLSPEDREIMEGRMLEIPSEEINPLETAKMLIHKFRQFDRTSLDYSDLTKVLLTNAITINEKHGIQVFADLNNYRLLFEVNGQTVSTLQYHDLNDLNEHLEKLSAAELIEFAKEQYVINLKNNAPPKISEQDAKKHDILMANTKAHFASYEEVKQAHPEDIVLFQRGDFFEMYGPDARVASVELDIHLTNRNIPELGRVAMCGIPANNLDHYLELLRKEHDVTISTVPENGAERQTYYVSSYKDVPKDPLAPPYSDSLDQASEQIIIATPQMVPNIDEYTRIKGQFPGYVVGVQNGDTLYFYGTDAEKAGPALNRNVLIRDIPGMGAVSITGNAESWQASKEKLLRKGIDLTFVRLDETGKYEIIITSTAAEYIPVGMELDIDERRCRIESVDFQQDAVRLAILDSDLTLTESVSYVREYVEEAFDKELEKAAEEEKSRLFVEHVMEDVEQLAEQEPAPTIREIHEHYKSTLLPKLMEDEAYRNACQNSDRQNAIDEGRNAVERAAKDLGITQAICNFISFILAIRRSTTG